MIIDFDNLTPWELSELESLMTTEPAVEPISLYEWESKKEAQEHIAEFGDMTDEDYRARRAYEHTILMGAWARRAA